MFAHYQVVYKITKWQAASVGRNQSEFSFVVLSSYRCTSFNGVAVQFRIVAIDSRNKNLPCDILYAQFPGQILALS